MGYCDNRQPAGEGAGFTRRSFLKGSGILAGATFAAAMGLTGCSEGSSEADKGTAEAASGSDGAVIEYDVFDTEFLIVGSGFAGTSAAFQAYSMGAQVTIVDKGPFSFSGAAGMNWDEEVSWMNDPYTDWKNVLWNESLANQKFIKAVFDFTKNDVEALDLRMHYMRNGGTTWSRNEDGTWENLMLTGVAGMNMIQGGFSRHMQDLLKSQDIRVLDNTMVTDLFVQDGACIGLLGYHVPTGRYRVIRSKVTLLAGGGSCQMYGWHRTHPRSMNTPDNSGDLEGAVYRHGCSLISNEFFGLDLISMVPESYGCSFNSGMGADGNHMMFVCDKDGEFFMRDFIGYDISRPVREAIIAGRGGDHGGLFLNLNTDIPVNRETVRPIYARNIELWKEQFGIDVFEEGYMVPVTLEAFEHGQGPIIDERGMTEIPGLFSVRGCGRMRGDTTCYILSPYVASCAADYLKTVAAPANVDWSIAEAEFDRLDAMRTADNSGGKRPWEIRRAIQEAFYEAWEPCTDADKLNACIEKLELIKEDMAKVYVADQSKAFNVEWRTAIENEGLMISTEAAVRSGLMREESRLTFFRSDFPEQDDENWLAWTAAKLVDGKMVVEKVEIPQVEE